MAVRTARRGSKWRVFCSVLVMLFGTLAAGSGLPSATAAAGVAPQRYGELDCNGFSPIQQSIRLSMNCTDIRSFPGASNANTWGGRFYDNSNYIGHDEPDLTFYAHQAGTGNNVTWTETLPVDPAAAPTVADPGHDVADWFELSVAPWFSMAMCDPNSYPQLSCTPLSDANAPTNSYSGGGSAFMEMQFYPPGFAPFLDAPSCDNSHWCAALTIDSLECTSGYASCNNDCVEPVNFAFIQTNGVPAGPPSPQLSDLGTFTQNHNTLLMNPGDRIIVHMADAPVPGGGGAKAFEVVVYDLTTGQSGFMQASAQNGFMSTSMADCSGTPFNFQPEYSTADSGNVVPWAALQTDISTEFEIGHFEACTSLSQPLTVTLYPGVSDTTYNECAGPYEDSAPGGDGPGQAEPGDAFCYPAGDTHGALASAPDKVTGCTDQLFQNGDLDFDGTGYWPEWPTGTAPTATFPASFVQSPPISAGHQYEQFSFQSDVALSESTCTGTTGCAVPPPNAPGAFYPYWSMVTNIGSCVIEFGNVSGGKGVNDFGGDAQYGTNQYSQLGYPEFESKVHGNSCHP